MNEARHMVSNHHLYLRLKSTHEHKHKLKENLKHVNNQKLEPESTTENEKEY